MTLFQYSIYRNEKHNDCETKTLFIRVCGENCATTLIYAIRAGITAAAGTRLAL